MVRQRFLQYERFFRLDSSCLQLNRLELLPLRDEEQLLEQESFDRNWLRAPVKPAHKRVFGDAEETAWVGLDKIVSERGDTRHFIGFIWYTDCFYARNPIT